MNEIKIPLTKVKILMLLPLLGLLSCAQVNTSSNTTSGQSRINLVDAKAEPATKALYLNLKAVQGKALLFGQQNAFRGYGINNDKTDVHRMNNKCDVFEVSGAYPAVYGWDFYVGEELATVKEKIKETYARGGIHTFCYHMYNPVTGGNFREQVKTVKHLLPGGSHHQVYRNILDQVAFFAHSLTLPDGTHIPIIFRPFHEHTGSWFWWGNDHCTKEEFIQLWQFTVTYLRDQKKVHNFLYAYSSDVIESKEHYLERYPGDAYVDIMGIDIYRDVERNDTAKFIQRLRHVVQAADEHQKVPALTETGYSVHTVKDWWTNFLLSAIKNDPVARRLAYAVLWQNHRDDHYFSIWKGHFNEENFRVFERDPYTWFEKDLPNMYRYPSRK